MLDQLGVADFQDALSSAGIEWQLDEEGRPRDELLLDLAVEYTYLFIGPGAHISPHESVHVEGGDGMLSGPVTAAVQQFIESIGFTYQADYHGLPDHISVELEFMQALTRLEAQAWREVDEQEAKGLRQLEAEFIHQHLARWVPLFCEQVIDTAELPFYREMARLTLGFIKAEQMTAGEWIGGVNASLPGEAGCTGTAFAPCIQNG